MNGIMHDDDIQNILFVVLFLLLFHQICKIFFISYHINYKIRFIYLVTRFPNENCISNPNQSSSISILEKVFVIYAQAHQYL